MSFLMCQVKAKFHIKKKNFKAVLILNEQAIRVRELICMGGPSGWKLKHRNNDPTQDITSILFIGESRGGEKEYFKALAPYVEPGSYIQMAGEDFSQWRWVFNGKTCKEVRGKLTFEAPK